MKHIEFSEMTNRLRRNLIGSAFMIIAIVGFGIEISEVSTSGMKLSNLTTEKTLVILLIFLLYHGVAFAIRACEEFKHWSLTFGDSPAPTYGGMTVTTLTKRLESLYRSLENSSSDEAIKTIKAVQVCANGLKNFPIITSCRFWGWDVGFALATAVIAVLSAFSVIPTGFLKFLLP